jgi:hypothetical protein
LLVLSTECCSKKCCMTLLTLHSVIMLRQTIAPLSELRRNQFLHAALVGSGGNFMISLDVREFFFAFFA